MLLVLSLSLSYLEGLECVLSRHVVGEDDALRASIVAARERAEALQPRLRFPNLFSAR